ncbi:hypothetical protein A3B46_03265 [Candidatus Roizmanbacteria bacterium RIFCSPLOWO2_01_FULL_39_19]|nr:MAG: hypothetical protein A3B46_03265 [Candidatus Roizmanbacteria bacterium RIFCSPLOWO2_01_FULL_39_19]
MQKRQLSWQRLYKLVNILVLLVTILSAILGLKILSTRSEQSLRLTEEYGKCVKRVGIDQIDICFGYIETDKYIEKLMWIYLGIAVITPLVFYGGGALYRYLFPIKEKGSK